MLVPDHPDVDSPTIEEPIVRLHRSGWRLSVRSITDAAGLTRWQIEGCLGENRLKVDGATREEAWRAALLAAAECGLLQGYRRPPTGRE